MLRKTAGLGVCRPSTRPYSCCGLQRKLRVSLNDSIELRKALLSPETAVIQATRRALHNSRLRQLPSTLVQRKCYATSSSAGAENKTALYDLHVKHGGKMVPFGGFSMPVQYGDLGIGDSHRWTREKASLFDVGHMVQHEMSGSGVEAFLSRITPTSFASLKTNFSTLSCLLHRNSGGIVDDTVITRRGEDTFFIVTNAACREKDLAFLKAELADFKKENPTQAVEWTTLDSRGLIALQGPCAKEIMKSVVVSQDKDDLTKTYFGQCKEITIKTNTGEPVTVLASRGGYTGEDGFEISTPDADSTIRVTQTLLDAAGPEKLRLAGLGARDSLRLEAGMCLYGHDLDDTTTPVEGGLSWVIGKDRREQGGFNGSDNILAQLKPKTKGGKGVERRRVGLVIEGAPAREGAVLLDGLDGTEVGKITSGCPSPTLGKNIAMGYVKDGSHKSGTELYAVVRGKKRKATVTKMPFIATQYHKEAIAPG